MTAQDQPNIPNTSQPPKDSQQSQVPRTSTQQTPPKGWHPAVSVITIILTTLVLFFGGYFYLQYLQDQNIEEKKKTEIGETRNEEERLKQIQLNVKNDQIRKLDITNLNKGLKEYFGKNKEYPKNLEELTPDYLLVIPLDPVTKEPYAYVPNEDFSGYTLSAKLSDGGSFSRESE